MVEALALCRPVLGYAHGGVGELLAELYPAGRVPPRDTARLVGAPPSCAGTGGPAAVELPPGGDMQQATLALYSSLARR